MYLKVLGFISALLFLATLSLGLSACSLNLKKGNGVAYADPVPNGAPNKEGTFLASIPAGSVLGQAILYQQSAEDYTLRLSSFSFSGSGSGPIQVVVNTDSATQPTAATFILRGNVGDQNYPLSLSPNSSGTTPDITSVTIEDSGSPPHVFSILSF